MKLLKIALQLAFLSLAISGLLFYVTAGVIRSSLIDILGEIFTTALILFIFLLVAYVIAKTVVKTAIAARKKSLPNNKEGRKL
jgi:cytochrome b subunit of formate dehydrogenase